MIKYPTHTEIVHRCSVDSSNSSCGDSGRPVSDPKQNINIRAAVIHVIGDFIQSIGVLIAAIVIKLYVSMQILTWTYLFIKLTLIRYMNIKKIHAEISC